MNRFFAISKRVLMFLAINLLVVLTISLVLNLLNIPMTIGDGQTGLLIMCLIWGMGGGLHLFGSFALFCAREFGSAADRPQAGRRRGALVSANRL